MNSLVSIIIPVYNVLDYVEQCILSVINQTYKNLEILVIDDGSNDGSELICDIFSKKDFRIRVFHQKNQGPSAARNLGLDNMHGDFVMFVDSDDILGVDAVSTMMEIMLKNKSDIVIPRFVSFVGDCKISKNETVESIKIKNYQAIENMAYNDGFGHEAWSKLYRAYLWNTIRFPVGILYEDYATIYYVVYRAHFVTITSYVSYYYRVRKGSIMNSKINANRFVLLDISDEITDFLIQNCTITRKAAIRLNIVTYLKMEKLILDLGFGEYEHIQSRIRKRINEYWKVTIFDKKTRYVDKIKLLSYMVNKTVFYFVYKFGDFLNEIKK